MLTEWALGQEYAHDLRKIAATGVVTEVDLARADALVGYLLGLHGRPCAADPLVYRRSIRDLVGHGEGIFGMIDGYGDGVAAAPPSRLQAIESSCMMWRHRLSRLTHRVRHTHGDFHPFNIVFDGDKLSLLDAARGGFQRSSRRCQLPGDQLSFPSALGRGDKAVGLRSLYWYRFWSRYLDSAETGDRELLAVTPPFLARRALVLACPRWYPDLPATSRDRLFTVVERALAADAFDPSMADDTFG